MIIAKACVIGAGVMGSGIAAHIANAGVPVLLLDIVPPNSTDRSSIAKAALERLAKTDPAPLMSKSAAKLITPGNIEDDLKQLADVDWIIEAVAERPDIKQQDGHPGIGDVGGNSAAHDARPDHAGLGDAHDSASRMVAIP